MKTFRNLTPAQSRVFEQIAIGNDRGHNYRIINRLFAAGLIDREEVRDGYFHTWRYFVPLPLHMEWCQWCSEQPDDETHPSENPASKSAGGSVVDIQKGERE